MRRPDYKRPVIEVFSEVDIKAMLGAREYAAGWSTRKGRAAKARRPEALRDQAIIITLVDTGVRVSELCNFKIKDHAPPVVGGG